MLTRSCDACVRAKRKCSLTLPTCERCLTRELQCSYRNEPLSKEEPKPPRRHLHSALASAQRLATTTLPVSASSSILSARRVSQPPCIVPVDLSTSEFMRKLAQRHVVNYGILGGNSFIHKSVEKAQIGRNIQQLCRMVSSISIRQPRLQADVRGQINYLLGAMELRMQSAPNLYDMLTLLQALIIIQIMTLFILRPEPLAMKQAESRQRLLHVWTGKLWKAIPAELPLSLSSHAAFVLAESVRRTIIVSNSIQSLYHACKFGWIEHNAFLDTLPFERMSSLWDIPENAFDQIFSGKQNIISWRELVNLFDAGWIPEVPTAFETMLLVGAKSKPVVEAQLSRRALSPVQVSI